MNKIALLVLRATNAPSKVREIKNLKLLQSAVLPYLFYNQKLKRFLVSANYVDGHFFFDKQKSSASLLKPEGMCFRSLGLFQTPLKRRGLRCNL